jgi:DNA-binding NarL/FixJ family response regulator
LKASSPQHLFDCLSQVYDGGVYVSPEIDLQALFAPDRRDNADPFETLSSREYQVFSLLVDGIRAKEIAARLKLSPKTVDTYRSSLMRKLNIHDVAGLVKFAINRRFTSARA